MSMLPGRLATPPACDLPAVRRWPGDDL